MTLRRRVLELAASSACFRATMPAIICMVAPMAQQMLIKMAVTGRAVSSRTMLETDTIAATAARKSAGRAEQFYGIPAGRGCVPEWQVHTVVRGGIGGKIDTEIQARCTIEHHAQRAAADPIGSMSAVPTCAAPNNAQAPPVNESSPF
jgi:hypothetical protein